MTTKINEASQEQTSKLQYYKFMLNLDNALRFQNHVVLLYTNDVSLPQTRSGDSTVNKFSEYQKKLSELFV